MTPDRRPREDTVNLLTLTRSAVIAAILASLVTFLPGLRQIQVAEAVRAPWPLPRVTETAVLAAQPPPSACLDRTRIVQDCTLADLPGIRALERQVIADRIAQHQLPADAAPPMPAGEPGLGMATDNASRLLSWERNTLRTFLWDKIALIVEKPQRSPEEQAIVDALATLVGQKRLVAATEAKRYYNSWQSNPCSFTPPAGFAYTPPQSCSIPNAISSVFQNPPSLEQFQAYGAAAASSEYQNNADLQAAAREASKAYGLLAALAASGIAAAAVYSVVVSTALGTALASALIPFAGVATTGVSTAGGIVTTTSATAAAGAAFAAAAAIVVVCIAIAVIAGITIFTAAQIPAKLDAAIEAARTPPDLRAVIGGEAGKQEVFASFLQATVRPTGAPMILGGFDRWAPVPAAQTDDPRFLIDPGPSQQTSATLAFKGWERDGRARLSQGWLVDEAAPGGAALTLGLDYINHAGERWTAWRIGDHFLHSTAGNIRPSFESNLIQYQDPSGTRRTARMLLPGLSRPTAAPTFSPSANDLGWHNAPVTVTWNWIDNAGVGLEAGACPATSTLAPGEIASVTCTDLAGNRGSATASARVDTRTPAFNGPPAISPAANAAGWHNTDVTVTFSCNDGEQPGGIYLPGTFPSGIVACGPGQTLTTEGRDQSVTGTATDRAGNTATQTATGINIDKTAPRFVNPPGDQTIGGTSATGGRVPPLDVTDNLDPAPVVDCTPAILPLGPTRVTCTATDAAGNSSAPVSFTLTVVPGCNGVVATIVAQPGVPTIGTPGRDVIAGTDGPDEIRGGDGDDLICGYGGDDRIFGEGGDDTLYGGDGDDYLDGGAGQDYIDGGPGNDTLLGGAGNDWLEDREGMNQTFDGGGGDTNRCIGVRTAAPAGTIANCQIRFQ